MTRRNWMRLSVLGLPENEAFARSVVAAFAAQLNPTLEELSDIKTAVSEAVTNSIVHGYAGGEGEIAVEAWLLDGNLLKVVISDEGKGIEDIAKAMEPFYTTCPGEERSGMGFTMMETFMDTLKVISGVGKGTTVEMTKRISVPSSPDRH